MRRTEAAAARHTPGVISARAAAWALLFAVLTGVGAHMRIPLFPVPVTMQVFFVILAGLVLGPFWGASSQVAYLLAGLCGAPFFAAPPHSGPAVLLGPTAGYLVGFVACSYLAGALGAGARRMRPAAAAAGFFGAGTAGIAAVYLCGTLWLGRWTGDLSAALHKGTLPFIFPDLIKAAGAAAIAAAELRVGQVKRKRSS